MYIIFGILHPMSRKKSTSEKKFAAGITWDLSDLYTGMDDPSLSQDKEEIAIRAKEFTTNYKNNLATSGLTASLLHEAITTYESLMEKLYLYSSYASYLFSRNTT